MTTMIHTVLRRERWRHRVSNLRRVAWELSKGFIWAVLVLVGFVAACGLEQWQALQDAVALYPNHTITITER